MYGHVAVQIGEAPDGSMVTREVRQPDGYFGPPGSEIGTRGFDHPDPTQ